MVYSTLIAAAQTAVYHEGAKSGLTTNCNLCGDFVTSY